MRQQTPEQKMISHTRPGVARGVTATLQAGDSDSRGVAIHDELRDVLGFSRTEGPIALAPDLVTLRLAEVEGARVEKRSPI